MSSSTSSELPKIKIGRPIDPSTDSAAKAARRAKYQKEKEKKQKEAKKKERRDERAREALIEAGYAAAQSRADALKKSRTDHPSEDITHLWKDHVPVPLTKAPSSETPLAERLLSGKGRELQIPVFDLQQAYPNTRLRRRVTTSTNAPAPLTGIRVNLDGSIDADTLPPDVELDSDEFVPSENRTTAYPLSKDEDPAFADVGSNELPTLLPTNGRRSYSGSEWTDEVKVSLDVGEEVISHGRGIAQPAGTSRGPTIKDINQSAKGRREFEKMVEIPPFIQANAFAMYNPGYVHMVDGFVLFQEYAHRMDPLTHEPMGKSRVPGYWSASARRGLLAMLVPRAKAYEKVYRKMTDILGCPIVVDATGETALLTLKAPSFVCMGHQKLKVDFDHCNATIGLDPRHGADAKVFHDGVWVGQADDHVDLVANMVGPSDEAALRRSLAIKEVTFYDSEVLDWLSSVKSQHSEIADLIRVGQAAHDGTIAGMKDPSLFKYVSRLCPSRANFSGDTPIPHFDSKDAPMSFSAGFSSGDYEWLEVRQYEMGIRYWAPPNSLMLLRSNRQIHSTHLWGANRNRFTTVMFYHSRMAVASFGMFRRNQHEVV